MIPARLLAASAKCQLIKRARILVMNFLKLHKYTSRHMGHVPQLKCGRFVVDVVWDGHGLTIRLVNVDARGE